MWKRALAVTVVCVIAILSLSRPANAIDGRQWQEMTMNERARYLMGIYEGMAFYESNVLRRKYEDWEIKKYFPIQFTIPVVMQSVDLFYADATNTLFPLSSVLYILAMELDVGKHEEVEAYKERIKRSIQFERRYR